MKKSAADRVGVGIIGAGLISVYHIEGLLAAGGADLRVIAARSTTNAGPLAARHGIAEVVTDHRTLLERPDVEAVVIATPDALHEAHALAAIEAGKAILLQKPMACTSASCRRLLDAARAAGVDLQVSYMHRHFEEVVRTRELLAQGGLGEVQSIRLRNATPGPHEPWFYDRDQVAGGVVMQLGIHGIDLLRHLFGEIEAVRAVAATQQPERHLPGGQVVITDLEDTVLASYRMASGALVSHEMSFCEPAGTDRFRLEFFSAESAVQLRTERGLLALFAPELSGEPGWFLPQLAQPALGQRHHRHWLDIVRGRTPTEPTAEDGLAGILVAEAVLRAAASGREEQLDTVVGEK
jgi:predicted dehydrogenase